MKTVLVVHLINEVQRSFILVFVASLIVLSFYRNIIHVVKTTNMIYNSENAQQYLPKVQQKWLINCPSYGAFSRQLPI